MDVSMQNLLRYHKAGTEYIRTALSIDENCGNLQRQRRQIASDARPRSCAPTAASRATRHTDTNKRRLTDADSDGLHHAKTGVPSEYKNPEDMYRLFFVDDHWYLFFRYHQLLCDRLFKIYKHSQQIAQQEEQDAKSREQSVAEALKLRHKSDIAVDEYYPTFLDIVRSLLDGNTDSGTYEDTLREMFGIHAYIAFTLDKVVHNCVRQLQYLVQDETSSTVKQLYVDELRASNLASSSSLLLGAGSCGNIGSGSILSSGTAGTGAGGGGCGGKVSNMSNVNTINAESAYQKKSETLLHDQNCYKIILVSHSSFIFHLLFAWRWSMLISLSLSHSNRYSIRTAVDSPWSSWTRKATKATTRT